MFAGFPFPLGPLFARQTVRYEVCAVVFAVITRTLLVSGAETSFVMQVVPDTIWTFEQEQVRPLRR